MITIGRPDVVRAKPERVKKVAKAGKREQEFGCSDVSSVSNSIDSNLIDKDIIHVQSNDKKTNSSSLEMPASTIQTEVLSDVQNEPAKRQSTGENDITQSAKTESTISSDKESQKSKTIMSSIKSFFKLQFLIVVYKYYL